MMEGPLTELRNQRLPRRKMAQTYGKKKAATASTARRELFGTDENQIEAGMANLRVATPRYPQPIAKNKAKQNIRPVPSVATTYRTPGLDKQPLISDEDAAILAPLLEFSERPVDTFSNFWDRIRNSCTVKKVGEGSFAEVYNLVPKTSGASSSSAQATLPVDGIILKIIALETPSSNSSDETRVTSINSIVREVKVLRALDTVHGFTRYRDIHLVTGKWPTAFLNSFHEFMVTNRSMAANSRPDRAFGESQIYALIEMDHAGREISALKKPNVFQVYDVFWQTAILLAHAEEQVKLEHRDLHISNLCIKPQIPFPDPPTKATTSKPRFPDIDPLILLNMEENTIPTIKLGLTKSKVTIIDYTFTRCVLTPETSEAEEEIASDDMPFVSHLNLKAVGSNEEEYQLKTYLKCKAAIEYAQRKSGFTGDKYQQFVPQTNVIWLAYLLKSMTQRSKPPVLRHYIVRAASKTARSLQREMWETLEEVEDAVSGVDPDMENSDDGAVEEDGGVAFSDEELERTPASAGALLAMAVEKGWLLKEEIEAFKRRLESEA